MESLKRHGLYAMWLVERLGGWRRQWLGRLAAGRVITGLPEVKAATGSRSKLTALYVSPRAVPTTDPQAPAKVLSPQTPLGYCCINQLTLIYRVPCECKALWENQQRCTSHILRLPALLVTNGQPFTGQ